MFALRASRLVLADVLAVCALLFLLSFWGFSQEPISTPRYIPPELQVSDPTVKGLLDEATKKTSDGDFTGSFGALQKALELARNHPSAGDKAIIEDLMGVYYFSQGRIEDAKTQWFNS